MLSLIEKSLTAKMIMKRAQLFGFWGATLICCVGLVYASVPPKSKAKKTIDFNRDVRPILAGKCFTCHGNDVATSKAGLRLDSKDHAFKPLKSGDIAIVPGKPEASELVRRILSKDESELMPPPETKKFLTPEEKAILKQWILEGAEYKSHWAFVAPTRPELPVIKNKSWVRNPIDAFILEKMEAKGLKPSPEADKENLLRRLTLDLTGLPPTLGERTAFLADKTSGSYEKLVDRLLASPRFAERMAMDWMDYSRYADSNGYQADYERFQWRWRDWVIEAYNKNMPFDQFTIEQIAGDMLPKPTLDQLIATGFSRNHRINTEGGVIAEEWRTETVIDRVETTSTIWLGLTSGCARCHDHKYDPISQKEFYSMYSYFNNVPETGSGEERPVNHPPLMDAPYPDQAVVAQQLGSKLKTLDASVKQRLVTNLVPSAKWKLSPEMAVPKSPSGLVARYVLGAKSKVSEGQGPEPKNVGKIESDIARVTGAVKVTTNDYVDLGAVGDFEGKTAFSYSAWVNPTSGDGAIFAKMDTGSDFRGWDCWIQGFKPAIHIINKWPMSALKVVSNKAIPSGQWSNLVITYDGSETPKGVKIYLNGSQVETYTETDGLKGSIKNNVPLRIGRRNLDGAWKGSVDDLILVNGVIPPATVKQMAQASESAGLLMIPEEKRTAKDRDAISHAWSRTNDAEYRRLDDERAKIQTALLQVKSEIPSLMIMKEMPKPRLTRVLIRGQYDKFGEEVKAGLPKMLPSMPKGAENNRLGFAKWLVDKQNPLTPRVTVNRFWERFFGIGLVASSEDFGTRADFPTHPELLDWLAVEFRDKGWNVKQTMKTIVMSATYRQSSKITPTLLAKDPENKVYARGPRFRLPAEVIRDQALSTAGLLVNKLGGRSVRPYQPAGIWDELNVYGNLRNYKPDMGDGRYRRSLYTIWKRTAPPPNMTLFDAPSREMCRVRRSRTNTPLQALALLNDVTYVEASRALAERIMREGGKDRISRIKFVFEVVLGRRPSAAETSVLDKGLQRRIALFRKTPSNAVAYLSVGDRKPDAKFEPAELAAYTIAASTILNLDETVTKE